ncbi:hypothetical protein MMC13_006278 [Lambiella insularis]|nr:hypothetical protein [Lambiella insularis]
MQGRRSAGTWQDLHGDSTDRPLLLPGKDRKGRVRRWVGTGIYAAYTKEIGRVLRLTEATQHSEGSGTQGPRTHGELAQSVLSSVEIPQPSISGTQQARTQEEAHTLEVAYLDDITVANVQHSSTFNSEISHGRSSPDVRLEQIIALANGKLLACGACAVVDTAYGSASLGHAWASWKESD